MAERIDCAIAGISQIGWVRGPGKQFDMLRGSGPDAASEGTWRLFVGIALWQRRADAVIAPPCRHDQPPL
jgi:hypothetical protein